MRRGIGGVLAVSLLLVACTQEYDDDTDLTSTPPLVVETEAPDDAVVTSDAPDAAATTVTAPGPVDLEEALPDQELREQVEWVLGLLDVDARGPAVTETTERFAAAFLDQVSAVELVAVFGQLRGGGPYGVSWATQSSGAGRSATLALEAEQPLLMSLALDEEGRIASLLFQPDTSGEVPDVESFVELDAAYDELGGQTQVVVGSVDVATGTCEVDDTSDELEPGGEPAPSGSVIKLLVLSAVVDAVAAGDLGWDEDLAITAELKSLPSGVLQDREDGDAVSVREAAHLMISISDNTATDLLIDAVGQPALRSAAEAAGIDATRIMPVASTRQFFQLGWQVDAEVRIRWSEARVPETKEAILADLPDDLDIDPATVTEPRWDAGVDWYLTGGEICSLHARLQQLATTDAGGPVRDILAANPGVGPVGGTSYQGFKGGSAPGVLAFSFYTESAASSPGNGRVLVVQTRSSEPVDQLRAATITEAGLQLLATPGG